MIFYYIYPIFLLALILFSLFVFYRWIYPMYKVKSTHIPFADLLTILNIIINSEVELYEKNVFATKGVLLNSQFDNYYYDICDSIHRQLSSTFLTQMQCYITLDSIYSIIARNVRNYLTEKTTTDPI